MDLDQPLVSSTPTNNTYQVIQSVFFMVAFSTGLGILGSAYTLTRFHINSLLAEFLIMLFILVSYMFSHHMIAYCCRESSQKYNFAEYLEDRLGKVAAMAYDILLSIHNVVLLSYIQFFVAHFMVETDESVGNADRAYYFLAVVNIPLIFFSLTGDFKRNKWFCVGMLIIWLYVFIGKSIETSKNCSADQYWDDFPINGNDEFGTWIIKLIGLQLYFASAFQSVPFIYKEVKKQRIMNKVINWGAIYVLLVYLTVYVFYTFDPNSIIEDIEESEEIDDWAEISNITIALDDDEFNCKAIGGYSHLIDYGRVLIGACGIIVNVIPARFALSQFLSGNDSENMKKVSGSDKLLTAVLIMVSIILALFMFNKTFWGVTVCLGVILSSILGILVPTVAVLFTEEYSVLLFKKNLSTNTKNKNKYPLLNTSDLGKKIFIFTYLVWAIILTLLGITSGFFILIDP